MKRNERIYGCLYSSLGPWLPAPRRLKSGIAYVYRAITTCRRANTSFKQAIIFFQLDERPGHKSVSVHHIPQLLGRTSNSRRTHSIGGSLVLNTAYFLALDALPHHSQHSLLHHEATHSVPHPPHHHRSGRLRAMYLQDTWQADSQTRTLHAHLRVKPDPRLSPGLVF